MIQFQALLPTKVSLAGYCVSIRYVDNIPECGLYEYSNRLIRISTNNHKTVEEVLSTIYHELMHAILDHNGYTELCKDLSDNFEEALVGMFEKAFRGTVILSKKSWIERKRVEFTYRGDDDD